MTGRPPGAHGGAGPRLIGEYRIGHVLGSGGMGVVYRGEHVVTGEVVAVKTVASATPLVVASIRREIHALGRVRHPGIVRIVAEGVSGGLPWYAMELLEGRTLRDHIAALWMRRGGGDHTDVAETAPAEPAAARSERPLPPRAQARPLGPTLSLLRRLCAPLAFLHGAGIVHRDLKPENVFIREGGSPVLVDLGIAAGSGGAASREELASEDGVLGTVPYMAPEWLRGELVDARADLYALGCILYECLTGRPPFTGAWVRSIVHQHLNDPPIPPSRLVEELPEELDALVLRLLEKRPQDRLGHAGGVAAVLAALGAEAPDPESAPRERAYLYRPELVGRDDVMAPLMAALRALDRDGRGQLVLLGGESGAGKTRLAMELARIAANRRIAVLTGQCVALEVGDAGAGRGVAAAALQPLRPLLLAVADRCRELGELETERLLGPRGKVLAVYEPALLDVPAPAEPPAPLSLRPEAARARVIESLAATIFALTEAGPHLLILDDLQWADELTLSLLEALSRADLTSRRLLVVGTHRIEEPRAEIAALAGAPGTLALELGRLDASSMSAMVSGMLALGEPPRELVDIVVDHAGGNPFFVAEYLRAAIGEGLLARDRAGRWRLEARGGEAGSFAASLPLPRTLADLIERRLAGLDAHGRLLVDWCAVLGREIEGELLSAAPGLSEIAAMDAFEALRRQQILEEARSGHLRFVHDKIREIAYGRIAEPARRELHHRAALEIEARHAGAPDRYAEIANHYAKAGVSDKASERFTRAGHRARSIYANSDAVNFYRAGIVELTRTLSAGAAPAEGWLDALVGLHEGLGDVLARIGRQEEARDAYGGALARLPERRRVERARLHRKIGEAWETEREFEEALAAHDAGEVALGDPLPAGAPPGVEQAFWHEWLDIYLERISVYYWMARLDPLTALVERVRPVVALRGTPHQRARFSRALVQMLLRRERYRISSEVVLHARESLAASEEAGDEAEASESRFTLALVLLLHGALDEAGERMRAALADATRIGSIGLQARCLAYLGVLERRRGRVEEARALSERGLAVAEEAKVDLYAAAAGANLAWVALRCGRAGEAEALAARALRLWSDVAFPFQWTARFPLLAVHLAQGRVAEAVDQARVLLAPPEQRLPDELAALLAEATSALDRGEPAAARALLERAMEPAGRLGFV